MCNDTEIAKWVNFGWAVGFWEGEGHVGRSARPTESSPHFIQANARATSTDLDVIERLVPIFGGKIYGPYAPSATAFGKKPIYVWQIASWPLFEAFYKKVRPLAGKRRAAALDALMEFRATMPRRRAPGCVPADVPSRAGIAFHYKRKEMPCASCRAAYKLWRDIPEHREKERRRSREFMRRKRAKDRAAYNTLRRNQYRERHGL